MSNVLTEIPVLGRGVAVLDGALIDLGLPPFVNLTAEFFALFVVLTVAVAHLGRLLPFVGRLAVWPTVLLVKTVRLLLLVPQQAIASIQDRRGRSTGQRVFDYGDGVVRVSDRVEGGIRLFPTRLSRSRRLPTWLALVVVAALFAIWNQAYCGPAEHGCVRPILQWSDAGTGWPSPAPPPATRHR